MPGALPKGLKPGTLLRHSRFYASANGELLPKFLLALAPTRGGDVVFRVLTSQHAELRPEAPPCHHGNPYPGFYLGVLDPSVGLGKKSWLDLRGLEDADGIELAKLLDAGIVAAVGELALATLRAAMECAAGAEDTTQAQERAIRDQLAAL